ncbi:MAG TPA: HEAT repeat domain-containing protein [Ktedonobacteraceae bacterium]|nr:HEAT repeat domain-containing protein [Ktedonobacteraceae bacterium]
MPQESIDSILLAMSHRDEIDPDLLSIYFDRLDQEWTAGARDKVLRLLRSKDISAHSAAVLILSELATNFDLEELEDLVADPTVSDMAKLTLAPILKELGSEMADAGLIEYLHDPESAMIQMQKHLLELIGQSELGIESVLEDVLGMPMEQRLGFISWLGMSQDRRATKLLIPLLENQSSKVALAAIESLEQLGPEAAHQSIPALKYLLTVAGNKQVKQRARAALGRLTMQSVPGTEDAAMEQAFQTSQYPLYDARVSFVDGAGAQMILIAWQRPEGLLKGVNVLYQDDWGIKDCYGSDDMDVDKWEELIERLKQEGLGSFQVPLAYCRALIVDARAVNRRTRHKLPVAYAVWRPSIEMEDETQKQIVETVLQPRPYTPDVAQLAMSGDTLYQLPEFNSWYYDPFEHLRNYVMRYSGVLSRIEAQTRERKRKTARLEASRADLETIVSEALEAVVDAPWRLRIESRLRRQAALFVLINRAEEAELLSAVASMLHPDSAVSPQQQPFLRAMMHYTLENGLMRMLTEMIESGEGPFGKLPLGPFKGDDDWGL